MRKKPGGSGKVKREQPSGKLERHSAAQTIDWVTLQTNGIIDRSEPAVICLIKLSRGVYAMMLSLMIWKQSAKESLATSFKHSNTPKQTSSSPANPNQEQPGTQQNHQKRFRYRHDGQRLINELDQPGLLHPCGLETLLIKHKRQQSGKKGLPSSQPSPSDDPRSIQDKVQRRLRMLERHEDKVPVVTAVNLAYDMILPRKQKNPLSGITLLNDSKDCSTKPEMTLVMTCTEAIQILIQSIGWSENHNPSLLWQLSNHTGGTYS
ncbi:hypothetical protein PtA15_1A656 [Puccinia triticina]|uniref:Uncharacterized protein n=1 Tax=Puccinia triticina TaxID=208348 RepID=A0ABY7C822_9BASI|nr:uncharacterized protein PtA15_1A656 [Puccinia triticina]WAQ81316.1 hypothetical protein PtA15_1A656 [Puccinia triticina]